MSVVTFWNSGKEETGKTLAIAAISTYMAIEHNYRILVISTSKDDKTIENCFWKQKKTKKNLGLFGPNTNIAMEEGVDGLIKIIDDDNGKNIYEDFGEMLFTHYGVSGPIILSSSAHLVRYKNIEEKYKNKKIRLVIDFKPALSEQKLEARILRDFEELKNKQYKNSLDKLLPQKLIPIIIGKSKIEASKKVNEITKVERRMLVNALKNFSVHIEKSRPIDEAIITSGGINIKEIDPKTMSSKLIKNLYFAGEIIDVDGYTGGFNLQIAYSTGYVAGLS